MFKRRLVPVAILVALFTGLYGGTSTAASRGNIEILQVQVNSADNALPVNERDSAWLKLETAPWTGTVSCDETWVYFNADASRGLLALAISAFSTGRRVSLWIEDSPTLTVNQIGYCKMLRLRIL